MANHFRAAPLTSTFMLTSILGFLVSTMYISDFSPTWGFTFSLVFIMMFLSSMISMTKAEAIDEHMEHLAIHEPEVHLKHMRKKVVKKEN